MRIRDLGYTPGILPCGPKNSILDVEGVSVGQTTVHEVEGDDHVHKGVTVILPRPPKDIQKPCYAGMHTLNGNGEVTGSYQIKEWGWTNTPLALTNSTSLGIAFDALWTWILKLARSLKQDDLQVSLNYGTPIVGETCDWWLNAIERTPITKQHVLEAFDSAATQSEVQEGSFGGGAGMSCHMFKGGTGTSSRVVKGEEKDYTVGVIVQSNYGLMHDLVIGGIPIGKILVKEKEEKGEVVIPGVKPDDTKSVTQKAKDGSIVIIIITDAPLISTQLTRIAQRATVGLCRVAGYGPGRTFSGDIFLALSTAQVADEHATGRELGKAPPVQTFGVEVVKNETIDELFRATAEATEEAILNSLVGARDGMKGSNGVTLEGLPVEKVKAILDKYLVRV